MPYVRVKDNQTGHEMSLPEGAFDDDAVTVLDKDAVDPGGEPLPTKYHVTLAPVETSPFAAMTVAELKDEIDRRNAERDPEALNYITPEEPGNKPELIAALDADEAPRA